MDQRGVYLSDQPRQPYRRCPYCGALHDGMTGINDRPGVAVRPGALMICADCGQWGVLDPTVEGQWRLPTVTETRSAMANDSFRIALSASRALVERRRG